MYVNVIYFLHLRGIHVIHLHFVGAECMFSTRDAVADQPDIEKELGKNPVKREAWALISKCKTDENKKPRWLDLSSIAPPLVVI